MDNTNDKIFFNFSYFALKLLGKGLYSNPWTAIAELVANGLDAKATCVRIFIDMSDKKNSEIEIFDNGTGMTYSDLAEKYVLIGKNKREDLSLDEVSKNKVMGRKGIGKLAALYLSSKYYLISKSTGQESAWYFDMSNERESEIPSLNRVNLSQVEVLSAEYWDKLTSGTMIKLKNVDLTNIGIQSMEGLKARLSDYYVLDSISGKIELAVRYQKNTPIGFQEVAKNIAFRNFYALFDNSESNIKSRIAESVYFPSADDTVRRKPRHTVIIDESAYNTSGTRHFVKEDGSLSEKEIPYSLTGWIGIHASIKKDDAQVNDPLFLKNKAYKSTQLRLYVRKKLAVEDFMPYLKNTQAFSNYIEGEINFDVLDDNSLGDIATSNRQGFAEDDERVALLISLVKPIVSTLIVQRVKVGQEIREEEDKIKKEHEAALKAAEAARQELEIKNRVTEKKLEVASDNIQKYKAQSYTIFSAITEDQKTFSAKTHLVKTNALTIRNSVTTLARKIGIENYRELGAISVATDKILSSLKYSAIAKFNIEDASIKEDLFAFCREYLMNVLQQQYFNIHISVETSGQHIIKFQPQNISLVLDNFLSNSQKSHARNFNLSMEDISGKAYIELWDDGDGFGAVDLNEIFDFGFSNTGGTGIGLYNIKTVIKKMKGTICAENATPSGAKFIIEMP